jgi:hypothetical protein
MIMAMIMAAVARARFGPNETRVRCLAPSPASGTRLDLLRSKTDAGHIAGGRGQRDRACQRLQPKA